MARREHEVGIDQRAAAQTAIGAEHSDDIRKCAGWNDVATDDGCVERARVRDCASESNQTKGERTCDALHAPRPQQAGCQFSRV